MHHKAAPAIAAAAAAAQRRQRSVNAHLFEQLPGVSLHCSSSIALHYSSRGLTQPPRQTLPHFGQPWRGCASLFFLRQCHRGCNVERSWQQRGGPRRAASHAGPWRPVPPSRRSRQPTTRSAFTGKPESYCSATRHAGGSQQALWGHGHPPAPCQWIGRNSQVPLQRLQ